MRELTPQTQTPTQRKKGLQTKHGTHAPKHTPAPLHRCKLPVRGFSKAHRVAVIHQRVSIGRVHVRVCRVSAVINVIEWVL